MAKGKGITNNAVEFLVTLNIDEAPSKKKIDTFLKTTLKEHKIVFDVAKGKSQENINNFINNNNNKKGTIVFDVLRGQSETNITNYFNSRKSNTQQIIFGVNEGATRAKINNALTSLEFNPLLLNLGVNPTSLSTINKFIDNAKVNKMFVRLDIEEETGFTNIEKKIKSKRFARPNLKFSVNNEAFNDIDKIIKETRFTGLKIIGKLDSKSTLGVISAQIQKMELPKFKVDVIANIVPSITKTAQLEIEKKVDNKKVPNTPKNATTGNEKVDEVKYTNLEGYKGSVEQVRKQIENQFKEAKKSVIFFEEGVTESQKKFIKQLQADGNKIKVIRNEHTNEITQITATLKKGNNESITTVYKQLSVNLENVNKNAGKAKQSIHGFVSEVKQFDSSETFDMDKKLQAINKKLQEAQHKGYLANVQIQEIMNGKANATNNTQLDNINNKLDEYIRDSKQAIEVDNLRNSVYRQREQILAQITRTEKLYSRTHDKVQAEGLKSAIALNSQDDIFGNARLGTEGMDLEKLRAYRKQLSLLQNETSQFQAKATEETKNQMGIISALKVAMEKFPIWMMASTAFYGTIRTIREFGTVIVDIDTKMTDLKKVMSEDTDFDKVFQKATLSAETFGKTISETMDAYVQFAKQGYKGDELETLANAGLVAGNVGDIEAGKASEYITASILQWGMESDKAMSVVDSWNELSNNYATTVENLAQGQAKAGATARALGMDFDQLNAVVGTLNARTKQSGNEIGNFIKSTFSNLVSAKGQGVLADLGVQLTDDSGNLRDVMEIYTEVAQEYQKLNQAEKNEVTLGLAGKYHISRMQTLLDDLASDNSMYNNMYESSINSQNSAMNENEIYMQSLQARINLARVEFEKLALAIGDAFMSEAMITGLEMFSSILGFATDIVSTIGALPTTFIIVVALLTKFSNRFNDVVKKSVDFLNNFRRVKETLEETPVLKQEADSGGKSRSNVDGNPVIYANTEATNDNTEKTKNNTKEKNKNKDALKESGKAVNVNTVSIDDNTESTKKNEEGKNKATKAVKLFSKSFLAFGLVTAGVGIGLEALFGYIAKVREEKEKLKFAQEQENSLFKANQDTIDSLSKRYKQLSEANVSPNTDEYAELVDVQNKLAELMPRLVKGEDAYGNAILQNSAVVESRIEQLRTQLEIQKLIEESKLKTEREEAIEEASDNAKRNEKQYKKAFAEAERMLTADPTYVEAVLATGIKIDEINSFEDLANVIKELESIIDSKEFNELNDYMTIDTAGALSRQLSAQFTNASNAYSEMQLNLSILKSESQSKLSDVADSIESLTKNGKNNFVELSSSVLGLAESASDVKDIETIFNDLKFDTNFHDTLNQFSSVSDTVKNETEINLDKVNEKYGTTFEEIKKKMLSNSGLEQGSSVYKNFETAIDRHIAKTFEQQTAVSRLRREEGLSYDEALLRLSVIEDQEVATSKLDEETQSYVDSLKKLGNSEEQRLGFSESLIDETNTLIKTYTALATQTDLVDSEQALLDDTVKKLIALYPQLNTQTDFRVDRIQSEVDKMSVLSEAHKNHVEDAFTEEENKTYNQALYTNARIAILQEELLALDEAYNEYMKKNDELTAMLSDPKNQDENSQLGIQRQMMANAWGMSAVVEEQAEKTEALNQYTIDLNGNLADLGRYNKRVEETTKSSSKETDKARQIAEKYALQLEKINTQLGLIESKKKKYATHSANYRKALQEENELLRQQSEIYQKQQNELGGLSGSSSSSSTQTTNNSSSSAPTLTTNQVKDAVFSFFKNKGLNDKAISGIMGNIQMESGFNTNATNKSSGAYGLVQWLGSRKDGLLNYAKSVGKDASDVQVQLDYIWKELNSSEKKTLDMLKNSVYTVDGYAQWFDKYYERSEGTHVPQRQEYARQYHALYGGASASKTSLSGSSGGVFGGSVSGSGDSSTSQEIERILQTQQGINDKIDENNFAIIKSFLEEFSYKRSLHDNSIDLKESEKENLPSYSNEYANLTSSQYEEEKKKRKLYNDELYYINKVIESGKLNEAQLYEILEAQARVTQEIKNSELAMYRLNSEASQSTLESFSKQGQSQQDIIDWENLRIQTLDKNSADYTSSLQKINEARQKQINLSQEEEKYITKKLKEGQLTSDMYETLANRAKEIKSQTVETLLAIRATNLEMIQTKVRGNQEKVDDIDFNISRSKAIEGLYEEGSADQIREMGYQLDETRKKLIEIEAIERTIKDNMSNVDLGESELEALESQLEENLLLWLDTKKAIQDGEKAIKDMQKTIDDEIKEMRSDIADEIIDSIKDAYEELRDIKIKAIEDEIEAEEKRHDKVIKQYDEELDMFNKIIDAKRREIEDEDRDRSHNMNMEELTQERQDLQNKLNQLSNVNTYAGKKEREELEKQIAEVNKKIQEEEYRYSKDLRLQALEDEQKDYEENIENLRELEEKSSEESIERLEGEQEYWNKYYDDLINDERRFAQIRKTLAEGTKEEIEAMMGSLKSELKGFVDELRISLPSLEDTLNGTMDAVGTNIRDSVIFELENLLKEIEKVDKETQKLIEKRNNLTNAYGSSYDYKEETKASQSKQKLSENDMKVMLSKFVQEKVATIIDPSEKGTIDGLKSKSTSLAQSARTGENASTLSNSMSFDDILSTLDGEQISNLGNFFSSNSSVLGIGNSSINDYIKSYGSLFNQNKSLSEGDKQVLLAKYMKEFLKPNATSQLAKDSIDKYATELAERGRKNTSIISPNINYDSALKNLSESQMLELGNYFKFNAGVVGNDDLRNRLVQYADNLVQRYGVSLDTGGMTKSWSGSGVDGKGGKNAIIHPNEIISNPIDSENMLKTSSIMQNIMKSISGFLKLPDFTRSTVSSSSNSESTTIQINIDKMSGTQSDIDNLAKQINNKLLREKGKR